MLEIRQISSFQHQDFMDELGDECDSVGFGTENTHTNFNGNTGILMNVIH